MEITFWGVRGSIPAPGPATVRYGGNTSCVSVRLGGGEPHDPRLRHGRAEPGPDAAGRPSSGRARARRPSCSRTPTGTTSRASRSSCRSTTPGNQLHIYGGAKSSAMLEGILEGQMAPQYFPVQTLKNLGATHRDARGPRAKPFEVAGCQVRARANPHGRTTALAFRIEDGGHVVVYATDAGYGRRAARRKLARALRGRRRADPRQHLHARGPAGERRTAGSPRSRTPSAAAIAAEVKRLVLFHYDQDYSDAEVDAALGPRQAAARRARGPRHRAARRRRRHDAEL